MTLKKSRDFRKFSHFLLQIELYVSIKILLIAFIRQLEKNDFWNSLR